MDDKFLKDGGYASRKLWFSIFCVAAILTAGKILAIPAVGEVVMGIVMVCSIYVAGNAVIKWKNASILKDQPKVDETEAEPEGGSGSEEKPDA